MQSTNSVPDSFHLSRKCQLTRNYSIASLIGIGLVAVSIVYFYQTMALRVLMEREGQANGELAQALVNTVWARYADYVWFADSMPAQELATLPVVDDLRHDILHKVQGLRIFKIKIYNAEGLVVFATEEQQIGENRASSNGFRAARAGSVASEIILGDYSTDYVEQDPQHRNLVATYVPVRRGEGQPVEGVFEIYSDVTTLLQDIDAAGRQILVVVTSLMLLLYLFLLMFVRRAHQMIETHEAEQQRVQQQRLDYLEHHDEVTGLLNRKGLLRQMQHYTRIRPNSKVGLGVVALKLLNLDVVSGGMEHLRVTRLVRQAAERISRCAASSSSLCHLDSSDFVLLVENLFSEEELSFIVGKLGSLFAEPFEVDGKSVSLAVVMGFDASWGEIGSESLVNNALLAMSECEMAGEGALRYEPAMESRKLEYLNLEVDITQALQRNEFMLYYQPKVSIATGQVTGMEALLRWHHPQRGVVGPGDFITLLEKRGYIVELGHWLLREACRQCQLWRTAGNDGLRVAVNISLKQLLSGDFVEIVHEALSQSGLPPQALELELTESILVEDMAAIGGLLHQLRELGVVLSIDDFGTGYSSLSYLTHLPFDTIKIDRSFIQGMMQQHEHAVLTRAIVTMAKSIGLKVVAEGVEDAQQLARVEEMGCDEVQGYYFSPGVSTAAFAGVVAQINRGSQILA